MPAVASSPIPAVLAKLGPLDADRIADLRPYLESVPDPRARRGRWYSLTAILLVCAWAVIGGAKSIDEIAEAGERASIALLTALGIRRHLLGWRRSPKPVTIGRVLRRWTATPWTRRWAPISPTGTARPRQPTHPRPRSGGSSPWTAKR